MERVGIEAIGAVECGRGEDVVGEIVGGEDGRGVCTDGGTGDGKEGGFIADITEGVAEVIRDGFGGDGSGVEAAVAGEAAAVS